MRKYVFWADFGMSIITAIVLGGLLMSIVACKNVDFEKQILDKDSAIQKAAEIAVAVAPAVQPIALSMPGSVWTVLLLNIASSVGAAIVAARKGVTP